VIRRKAASFRQFRSEPGLFYDLPFPVIFAEFHSRQGKRGEKTAIHRNLQGISRPKKICRTKGISGCGSASRIFRRVRPDYFPKRFKELPVPPINPDKSKGKISAWIMQQESV
jgi:hypothetical protein